MPATTRMYWLHCLTPTHVGTGRGIGYIDLPLYREKTTNWPALPGSGFKGVWADYWHQREKVSFEERKQNDKLKLAFGTADNNSADDTSKGSNAGALIPTDARLVCLPVRSFKGTFAWCTSRLALEFLRRDLDLAGFTGLPDLPSAPSANSAFAGAGLRHELRMYLEDLDFVAGDNANATKWAEKIACWVFPEEKDKPWRESFAARFAVLPDEAFDFLTVTGTEVVTRVRIDSERKTVADGQLWTEESLPAEAILSGLICSDRVYGRNGSITPESLLRDYATQTLTLQVGGKASVGRGKVRCVFTA